MGIRSKSAGIIIGFILVLAGVVPADKVAALNKAQRVNDIPDKWQYFKDIRFDAMPSKGQLVKVPLDQDVFNNASSDLSDLRILGTNQAEVPYKMVIERNTFNEENIFPARILNNSFTADYNLFIVDLGKSGFINGSLNIVTSSENFKRQVEIAGSNDMEDWNTLKTDGYIYDYTDKRANFKAQNTGIDYPENAYRYLKARIFYDDGEQPIAVSGVQISKITRSVSKEASIDPKYEIKENPDKRLTEIIIDLEKKGWPTSSISLATGSENFNREIIIYESGDKNNWRELGQGYIFDYHPSEYALRYGNPGFYGANLSAGYSESRDRYLKVEIYNGDDQPISVTGVSVKAILRSVAFQYDPSQSYRLYYGNNNARFPQYDLERFFPYLDAGSYSIGNLGRELANSEFKKEIPPLPPVSERYPYLLKSVLVLTILILGFFIFKFMKKVNPAGK